MTDSQCLGDLPEFGDDWSECAGCGRGLPSESYSYRSDSPTKRYYICKDCNSWEKIRRSYNISAYTYSKLLRRQGGVCAICGQAQSLGCSQRKLSIDHDHSCCPQTGKSCGKCIRGLLCTPCNQGIGSLRDSVAGVEAALRYLTDDSWRQRRPTF